jgi:hypothetical protein
MRVLVFLHGTLIMHKGGLGVSREERVKQVIEGEGSVRVFSDYIPIGGAVEKLLLWKLQGVELYYFSSHRDPELIEVDKIVLDRYGFPEGELLFRDSNEKYKDVAEKILPDIIVEDDCQSIGGKKEMVYPNIKPKLQAKIKSIVVKEFEGIDQLPNKIDDLLKYQMD